MRGPSPVAFLGLGVMGRPMAANLLSSGFDLVVWNRSPERCQELAARGAAVASTPSASASRAGIVLYSLGEPDAIDAVVFGEQGILAGIRPDAIAVDLGTNHPDLSRRQAEAFAARGAGFLDAPVFGSRPEAEARDLVLVVGGEEDVLDRARPVLAALSSSIHHMGPVGAGASMGLIGSLIVGLQIQALAEALVMGRKCGLDLEKVVEVIQIPDFRSPLFGGMGRAILSGDFAPVFSLAHMQKDADYLAELATELGCPLPGSALVRELIKVAVGHGHAHENASALVKALELLAGVNVSG